MKRYLLVLLTLLIACQPKSEFEGYSVSKTGVNYQLHVIGEDALSVKPGDYVTCDLVYSTLGDSIFFKGRRKFQLAGSNALTEFDKCILLMHNRDSMSFIVNTDSFFKSNLESNVPLFLSHEPNIKLSIKLVDVQLESEYLLEKQAFLSWIEDFGDYEQVLLKQFLSHEEISATPTESGLYYIILKEGHGDKIRKGDTIILHYEGKFLNGKFFDSTKKRNEAFGFVYGQEWQVIEGLEEAIGMMKEGERALFILPSELAWGTTGSSTGIIPPFTSLIFEVEIQEVRR